MKGVRTVVIVGVVVVAAVYLWQKDIKTGEQKNLKTEKPFDVAPADAKALAGRQGRKKDMGSLLLTSSVFKNNETVPALYTCDGEDINPPLEISGVPENAKSLVLIMDDPDAPMGTWDHWILWNIDPKTISVTENSVPAGAVFGSTSWGKTHQKYGGPCPPSGTHRYFFKLYVLDMILDLPAGSTKKEVEKAMEGHILDETELIGIYQRKK